MCRVERTPEIVAAVRDRRAQGHSLALTSEAVGVAIKTVRRIMVELGIPVVRTAGPSSWATDRVERLHALHRAGLSRRQIAHDLGITRDAVCGKLYRETAARRPGW